MSEHEEQTTFFDWVRLNREYASNLELRKAMKLCYSNQTGAHMSKTQASKMKAEGMTKGILDINLDMPVTLMRITQEDYEIRQDKALRGTDGKEHLFLDIVQPIKRDITKMYAGLRIEMKFGKNKLTPEQKEKKELFEEAGYKTTVCYSAVEAVRAVFEYLPFEANDYQGVKEFL